MTFAFKTILYPLLLSLAICAGILATDTSWGQGAKVRQTNTMIKAQLIINNQSFNLMLYDGPAAQAFARQLPLSINMKDLYQSEKYHYMSQPLPSSPTLQGRIRKGELMLFGNDCLVLFYKDFLSAYSYTPLGYMEQANALPAALGTGAAVMHFKLLSNGEN